MRVLASFLALSLVVVFTTHLHSSEAQTTPWKRRLRKGVVVTEAREAQPEGSRDPLTSQELRRLGLRPRGIGLVNLSDWPDEPASPANVAPRDLARAMAAVCPRSTDAGELDRYAEAIVRYGREFSVDPWLLAALVYTQSDCGNLTNSSYGAGLTLINGGMHRGNIDDGVYRYGVWTANGWTRRELDVGAFPFSRRALMRPESNLYFAAAFLRVFSQQCPDIDHAFESAPHRHPVSHFIWGDRVQDTRPEDRVLMARRRLLNSHALLKRDPAFAGVSFVSPLDGYPRVAISGLGEPRDHGRRRHQGIDFASEYGEPVRSVAAGTVTFAGVDWERRAFIPLEPWGATLVHERHMGPRGLFVEVDHGGEVVSLYAHLASYDVKVGDHVEAGQRLGEVGRSGVKDSGAHLHFGLFREGQVLDPLDYLAAYVFPPRLTKRGHAGASTRLRRHRDLE